MWLGDMKIYGLLLLAFLGSTLAYTKSYDGYQVYRTAKLNASTFKQLESLMGLPYLDFWTEPREGRSVDIMTSPEHVTMLKNELNRLGLEPELLIPDLETVIQQERAEIEHIRRNEKSSGRAPNLDRYLEWSEIEAYLDEVVAAFPSIASLITIGNTYEGRPMRVLKLSNGPGKSAIWFDAVAHAREWAGPPTLLYAINQLTENLSENQAMLDANDFYFLPVSNPDGYIYSWTDERLWRKTRNVNSGSNCIGTDPNRNYDYAWGQGGDGPCSLTYPGTSAFSIPETQAIRDFLVANPQITFFVNVHSYGEYLLYPWGDTGDLPPTVDEMTRVGESALDALRSVRGTVYELGSTYNVLYSAYGLAEDWAYEALGIPLTYVIELPGGGVAGFNPPASDIGPVTTETWEAYKIFAANIPSSRNIVA